MAAADLHRGDLVFWKGHVAILLDGARIIHANAHHMAVAQEPLREAIKRIRESGGGEPTAFRRPPGPDPARTQLTPSDDETQAAGLVAAAGAAPAAGTAPAAEAAPAGAAPSVGAAGAAAAAGFGAGRGRVPPWARR